jgi:hypothetical protein
MNQELFNLDCRAHNLLVRRLGQLRGYQGTDDAMDGDDVKIADTVARIEASKASMIAFYGQPALDWFAK